MWVLNEGPNLPLLLSSPNSAQERASPPPEGGHHPHLDEHLRRKGMTKAVHAAEPAHSADGQLPDLKHLVIQSHEQGLQARLGQVCIKAVQGRQDTVADVGLQEQVSLSVFLLLHPSSPFPRLPPLPSS